MLAISTKTAPLWSWVSWAVPTGAPLVLYMIAVAAATEFPARCALRARQCGERDGRHQEAARHFHFLSAKEMATTDPES